MTIQSNRIKQIFPSQLRAMLYIASGFICFAISSCFPENESYPPIPVEGSVGEINYSIYDYQTFYSLTDNIESASNSTSDWDLGFDCNNEGADVILNSGDILSLYNAGPVDISLPIDIPSNANWVYDASSGNTDSLAIKDWVNTNTIPFTYSHDVYVVRKNNVPFKKFKLIGLNENNYTIITSELVQFTPDTILVLKDDKINYQKLSLQNNNSIIPIEPQSQNWDLQFTTYQSVIPDDDGVPTPYVVRGVLHNPVETEVAFYYISEQEVPKYDPSLKNQEEAELEQFFLKLSMDDIEGIDYSKSLDAIGYDWKDVDIDFETGSAIYAANTRNIYLLKNQKDELYKLRFISFYNASGQKGYPTIHYLLME